MNYTQIAAIAGVAIFVAVRLELWRYLIPKRKPREPQTKTLAELVVRLKNQEDVKAWQRLIDLATD
jgi:hypothetical protein